MNIKKQLEFIVNGGNVTRYHTNDMQKPQTIAAHGFGTAALVWLLTDGQCRKLLLMAALVDDLAEQHTGDIPSPFKRSVPGLRTLMKGQEKLLLDSVGLDFHALTEEERRILSLADALDGLLYCARERMRGNRLAEPVAETFMNYAQQLCDQEIATERQAYKAVLEIWYSSLDSAG